MSTEPEPKWYKMTLYVADRQLNDMLRHLDLRPDYKWFITPRAVDFVPKSTVDQALFMKIIEESKEQTNWWIPAIQYMDQVYHDPSVKELSDGEKVAFLGDNPNTGANL